MKKRTKCYIYPRVSTSMQVDGYSLDAQRDKLRKYAEYEDMTIVGEYSDAVSYTHLDVYKRQAISSYGRTNKVKAQEFDERLRNVVDAYNNRDKLVFTLSLIHI